MNTNAVGTLGTGENSRFTAVSMAVTAMLLGSLALAGCGGGGTAPEGAMATQASADRMSAEGIEGSAFGGASELSEAGGLVDESSTAAALLDIAQARSITVVGVPVDQYGMRTDMLEALIAEHRPRLIYAAPTYHNPTGTVMPLQRRRQLLDSLKSL